MIITEIKGPVFATLGMKIFFWVASSKSVRIDNSKEDLIS